MEALADGRDPKTGAKLPASSPLEYPDVVRALHFACQVLEKAEKEHRREKRLNARHSSGEPASGAPPNAGKAWSAEDDRLLSHLFDSGLAFQAMAEKFHRTEGAIIARLVRIGKVSDRETARRLAQGTSNLTGDRSLSPQDPLDHV